MNKDLPVGWNYNWYCINCGAVQDNTKQCDNCGSLRIKKCPKNSYGSPIVPSRFMGKKDGK